jgi:manganese-dependent inorganic pyrophosphatase
MGKILITAKINPDLDGVACAYAYAVFLNSVDKENEYTAGIYGQPFIEARYLLDKFNIKEGLVFNPKTEFDKFILVDASELDGMPEVIRAHDVIEVIDHRSINRAAEIFPQAKIQIEEVGAAATLIFEKIKAAGLSLDRNGACLLLGAIHSNTLNFLSSITDQRDRDTVKILKDNYQKEIPDNLIEEMLAYKSEYIKNNLPECIFSDFKNFPAQNNLGIAQLETFDLDTIIKEKLSEIKEILSELKNNYGSNYIFLTAADLKNGYNIFVTIDEPSETLLSQSLGLSFNKEGTAKNKKLLLRKQILPLLINHLYLKY